MNKIVAFLSGLGRDHVGRSLEEILEFDDATKEFTHDYIQWMFPLNEASGSNFKAPILNNEDITEIRNSKEAQGNLLRSADSMRVFFERSGDFLRFTNHNHLRVTRIIKSLRLLHSDEAADKFKKDVFGIVESSSAKINPITINFWLAA